MLQWIKTLLERNAAAAPAPASQNPQKVSAEPISPTAAAALASIHDAEVLCDTFERDGRSTAVTVYANKIHLYDTENHDSQLIRLDDGLEKYETIDIELRLELGRRIAGLLPELEHEQHEQLLHHTAALLNRLVKDQSERVRQMLAQELAELPNAPIEAVRSLAWDSNRFVACPILEYSPLLTDQELLELLSQSDVPEAAEAIARRHSISAALSDGIIESRNSSAIGRLLENPTAHISEPGMNLIIDMAPLEPDWHASLITRPELTQRTVNRICEFVSRDLLEKLETQKEIGDAHRRPARIAARHRLTSWSEEQQRQADLLVQKMHKSGRLDNETIDDAIHEVNTPFVISALALRAAMTQSKVKKLLSCGSARAITALAWEAGLSMRSAVALQMKIGRVHHTKVLHARGGTDFPLPESEMQTYLDLVS